MTSRIPSLAVALVAALAAGGACAQANMFKFGLTRYTTHTQTKGITGIGVPPGADAETNDATTVIAVYERMLTPNIGAELALGIPPRIEARATGSVAFLGEDVLSARNVSPTLLLNWHFGTPGDRWRPYAGAGINFTRFADIQSRLADDVEMRDSLGWAVTGGIDYAIDARWGLFASVTALRVRTKLVAAGSTVLQSEIDFRPVTYSFGASYRF